MFPNLTWKSFPSLQGKVFHANWEKFPIPTNKFPSLIGNNSHSQWDMFPSALGNFSHYYWEMFPQIPQGNFFIQTGKCFPFFSENFFITTMKFFLLQLENITHSHLLASIDWLNNAYTQNGSFLGSLEVQIFTIPVSRVGSGGWKNWK